MALKLTTFFTSHPNVFQKLRDRREVPAERGEQKKHDPIPYGRHMTKIPATRFVGSDECQAFLLPRDHVFPSRLCLAGSGQKTEATRRRKYSPRVALRRTRGLLAERSGLKECLKPARNYVIPFQPFPRLFSRRWLACIDRARSDGIPDFPTFLLLAGTIEPRFSEDRRDREEIRIVDETAGGQRRGRYRALNLELDGETESGGG